MPRYGVILFSWFKVLIPEKWDIEKDGIHQIYITSHYPLNSRKELVFSMVIPPVFSIFIVLKQARNDRQFF